MKFVRRVVRAALIIYAISSTSKMYGAEEKTFSYMHYLKYIAGAATLSFVAYFFYNQPSSKETLVAIAENAQEAQNKFAQEYRKKQSLLLDRMIPASERSTSIPSKNITAVTTCLKKGDSDYYIESRIQKDSKDIVLSVPVPSLSDAICDKRYYAAIETALQNAHSDAYIKACTLPTRLGSYEKMHLGNV